MTRNKSGDHAASEYYERHLSGFSRFATNPTRTRKAIIQRMLMREIGEIAMNRFAWINLPKTVDPRFLEMTLMRYALSVFYYDFDLRRFMAIQGAAAMSPDVQDNPHAFRLFGNRFTPKTLTTDYCVPIWSNYFRVPDWDIVLVYASRIAEIDVTLEINAAQARRTKIITVDENRRLSYDNIVQQIDEGNPAVKVTEDILRDNQIQALDLSEDGEKLTNVHMYRTRQWNELMGALGINNSNQDKKERLVADEVDANNDQIAAVRDVNLNARKFAVAQINEMFGLDIDVMYMSDAKQGNTATEDNEPLPGMLPYEGSEARSNMEKIGDPSRG